MAKVKLELHSIDHFSSPFALSQEQLEELLESTLDSEGLFIHDSLEFDRMDSDELLELALTKLDRIIDAMPAASWSVGRRDLEQIGKILRKARE